MLTRVRLEAESSELQAVIASLDAAQKALKLPKEMLVLDEHYERVGETFKARRVFGPEVKGGGVVWFPAGQGTSIASGGFTGGWQFYNVSATKSL